MKNILCRPDAYYKNFSRKETGSENTTHYCPGCGHGVILHLIAEAISDFKCQNNTVMVPPVGCSVFLYYYLDTAHVSAAHGRASAVATGVKRVLSDKIVIGYQGDGDLAAIGTAEIIHAANRGENITIFFVNNAIYGMTGGQMAPTSILGQKTMTTPYGRKYENEGNPLRVSEIISTFDAPVYVERVSLVDVPNRVKARNAVRKAIQNQINNKGFSFVEVLSACPSNLKLDPVAANEWVKTNLHNVFPVKCFKDEGDKKEVHSVPFQKYSDDIIISSLGLSKEQISHTSSVNKNTFKEQKVCIAGFGGQGILSAGTTLAELGMNEELEVSWIPSYGPEMRGGTSNCHVKMDVNRIGSPLIEEPNVLIAMNLPSLDKFEKTVEAKQLVIINSSLIDKKLQRKDLQALYIPLTDICTEMGVPAAQSLAGIIAYLHYSKVIAVQKIKHILSKTLKRKELLEKNILIIEKIIEYVDKLKV